MNGELSLAQKRVISGVVVGFGWFLDLWVLIAAGVVLGWWPQ